MYSRAEARSAQFLRTADFYSVTAGGVRLVDWFTKIVNGEAPGQARD